MAGFPPLRKFKFRVQLRNKSAHKPRRVSLVAQRRMVKKGKIVTAGTAVTAGGSGQLNVALVNPKLKMKGSKIKSGGANSAVQNKNVKVGGKWKRTVQAGG